jgi:hypothetical protein
MVTNEVEEARRQMLEASRPHIVSTPQGPQTQGPQLVL